MRRKRQVQLFDEAPEAGPYDEWPIVPPDVEPQVHLSRNDRPQPFWLVCQYDTLLVQLAGEATVELKEAPVLWYTLEVGDFVYVPGGTPHHIVPRGESVQLRYKAREPGLEAVAWYCTGCGAEVWYDEWDTAEELPQEGYWRACQAFNAEREQRLCPRCGAEHPPVELAGIRWPELAAALREGQA